MEITQKENFIQQGKFFYFIYCIFNNLILNISSWMLLRYCIRSDVDFSQEESGFRDTRL